MLRAVLLVESICREVDTVQVRIAHPVFPGSFGILHLVRFESIKYFLTRNLQARKNEGPQDRTSAEPADNIWDLPSKDISVVYSNWGKIISALLLTTPFVFLTDFFSFSLKKENSRSVTYRWKANMKWKKSKKSVHSYLHGHAVEISWHWSSRGGSVSNGVGACFTEMNFRCGYAQTPPCYLQKNEFYVRKTQSRAQFTRWIVWSVLYGFVVFTLRYKVYFDACLFFFAWRTVFKEILRQIFKNRLPIAFHVGMTEKAIHYIVDIKSPTHLRHFSV